MKGKIKSFTFTSLLVSFVHQRRADKKELVRVEAAVHVKSG